MNSPDATARVKSDMEEGAKLGVTSTPTVFLNGKMVPPTSLNPTKLREAVAELLN
jgi:protein-disulfide isomerase